MRILILLLLSFPLIGQETFRFHYGDGALHPDAHTRPVPGVIYRFITTPNAAPDTDYRGTSLKDMMGGIIREYEEYCSEPVKTVYQNIGVIHFDGTGQMDTTWLPPYNGYRRSEEYISTFLGDRMIMISIDDHGNITSPFGAGVWFDMKKGELHSDYVYRMETRWESRCKPTPFSEHFWNWLKDE